MNKKLMSFSFGHDGAISYYDGSALHYTKLERLSKIKHDAFVNVNQIENIMQHIFHTSIEEMGAICIQTGIPENVEDFCKRFPHKSISVIDHHYAHLLSAELLYGESDVGIVIDGQGDDNNTWSIFKQGVLVEKGKWSDNNNDVDFWEVWDSLSKCF